MTITKIIENSGNQVVASNNGKVTINQTTGQILIRNGSNVVTDVSDEGFSYYDNNHVKRISMGQDEAGLQQIIVYGSDGKAQIVVGQDPADESPVIAVSEEGKDVLQELQNG